MTNFSTNLFLFILISLFIISYSTSGYDEDLSSLITEFNSVKALIHDRTSRIHSLYLKIASLLGSPDIKNTNVYSLNHNRHSYILSSQNTSSGTNTTHNILPKLLTTKNLALANLLFSIFTLILIIVSIALLAHTRKIVSNPRGAF